MPEPKQPKPHASPKREPHAPAHPPEDDPRRGPASPPEEHDAPGIERTSDDGVAYVDRGGRLDEPER